MLQPISNRGFNPWGQFARSLQPAPFSSPSMGMPQFGNRDSFGMNDPQAVARIAEMLKALIMGALAMQQQRGMGQGGMPQQPGRDLGNIDGAQGPSRSQQRRQQRGARRTQRSRRSRRSQQARQQQPQRTRSAQRNTGATGGPRSHNQTGIPNGLRQNAANGARVVREQFGFRGDIGGLGQRSGPSDHPHGNAIDVMTQRDTQMGRNVAEHMRQNHQQLGVKYVIYQQHIASARNNWQWRPMANRGSPTANHMDHVHVSFY